MRTRKPGQSILLLLDAVEVLKKQKIDYAVIGALAASVHGAVRASMDADAVLSLAIQQAKSLENAFNGHGFQAALTRGDFNDPIPAMLRLTDSYDNRVDLLIGLRGLDSDTFSRTIDIPFHGETLRVAGREDFIAMKVFAGGPQDMIDAQRALASAHGALDTALLNRLAQGYGKDAEAKLKQLLAT